MQEDGDDFVDLAVGTLDDPRAVTFARQIGVESRMPWFAKLHSLPEFQTQDTRSPEELARLKSFQFPDKA